MKPFDPQMLSAIYRVRRLSMDDVGLIYDFCQRNTQYYAYCGKNISRELIVHDLKAAPPGIPMEQKYYIGFFDGDTLIAVMDLIAGYPDDSHAFIGFFMMNNALQGRGVGSAIIAEALRHLQHLGFHTCRLAIDKGNPQSNHFWGKNGFRILREVEIPEGTVLLAEHTLRSEKPAPS